MMRNRRIASKRKRNREKETRKNRGRKEGGSTKLKTKENKQERERSSAETLHPPVLNEWQQKRNEEIKRTLIGHSSSSSYLCSVSQWPTWRRGW